MLKHISATIDVHTKIGTGQSYIHIRRASDSQMEADENGNIRVSFCY
jgi:hypothetical protein